MNGLIFEARNPNLETIFNDKKLNVPNRVGRDLSFDI
jgi:hypothetical protein